MNAVGKHRDSYGGKFYILSTLFILGVLLWKEKMRIFSHYLEAKSTPVFSRKKTLDLLTKTDRYVSTANFRPRKKNIFFIGK